MQRKSGFLNVANMTGTQIYWEKAEWSEINCAKKKWAQQKKEVTLVRFAKHRSQYWTFEHHTED